MPNETAFLVLAALTICSAVAAMGLRNLVHCALCAAGAFTGLAAIYLQLDAEFAGFAQILIYVGAIVILILFAVLLTKGAEIKIGTAILSGAGPASIGVAALVLGSIALPIISSPSLHRAPLKNAALPVKKIGTELMTVYVLPLETIGLLLTAALLGAVVIALREEKPRPSQPLLPVPKRGNLEACPAPRLDFAADKS